jgi:hypothetical protein
MHRNHWIGLLAGLAALIVLLHRLAHEPEAITPAPMGRSSAPIRSNSSALSPVTSRGRHKTNGPDPSLNQEVSQFDSASVSDGEWILSFPLAEPQMALRALTNGGIPVDRAKGLIRPVLGYLYSAAAFKERVSHADTQEIAELKRIRESDDYDEREKIGLMTVTAAAYRASRENWASQREEKLEEFAGWIHGLGVTDPEALMKDLLLIQPEIMPPAPKPH